MCIYIYIYIYMYLYISLRPCDRMITYGHYYYHSYHLCIYDIAVISFYIYALLPKTITAMT